MLSVSDHVVENGSLFLGTDMIQMPNLSIFLLQLCQTVCGL